MDNDQQTPKISSTLFENLAAYHHEQWAGWMRYLFTKGSLNDDGSFTIDVESVNRWKRQIDTDYQDLTEKEQESDKKEAKETLRILRLSND